MSHLTEDQLTDLILEGAPSPAAEAHLALCASCRTRVERELLAFGSSVADFNRASLAWSAAQPRPVPQPARSARPARLGPAWHGAWLAPAGLVFAALAVAAVLPALHHQHPAPPPVAVADTPSDIAADNALMQSVNVALASNEPSPLDEYHLTELPSQPPSRVPMRSR